MSGHIQGQNQVTGLTAPPATGSVMVRWCLWCVQDWRAVSHGSLGSIKAGDTGKGSKR